MKKIKVKDTRVGIIASEKNSRSRVRASGIATIGAILCTLITSYFMYVYKAEKPMLMPGGVHRVEETDSLHVEKDSEINTVKIKKDKREDTFMFSGSIQHSELQTGIADAIVYVGAQKVVCDKDGRFQCELSQNNFHEVQDVEVFKKGYSKKKVKYTLSEKPITINLSKTDRYEK